MSNRITQLMLDELISLSKKTDAHLADKIKSVLNFYTAEQKENQKTIKQCDRRNTLADQRDMQKDELLQQQSKLATMGEMIDAIAHQWKQPLNSISMMSDLLREDFKTGSVNESYIQELNENIHLQIDYMVNTLSEFRTFFRPTTKNENFTFLDALKSAQVLMKDELISQNILLCLEIDENLSIFGNKNEFKHLFINLINNSIDSFNEKDISNRKVYIRCYEENNNTYIEVQDNAGGVSLKVIDDIFEANVTTKKGDKKSGIGLYISEQIIKKNYGSINVHNTKNGALFTIILKQPTR